MICRTSEAYSLGRPSRGGNGTCAPSACWASGVMAAIIGVSNTPGAIATTRMPNRASSRAAGSVSDATPPFEAAVSRLADLAVERRHAGGIDDHAPLPFGVGRIAGHGRGRQRAGR